MELQFPSENCFKVNLFFFFVSVSVNHYYWQLLEIQLH